MQDDDTCAKKIQVCLSGLLVGDSEILPVCMNGCHLLGHDGFTEYVPTELSRSTLAFIHLKTAHPCPPWRLRHK